MMIKIEQRKGENMLEAAERAAIEAALELAEGNITKAASTLGIHRQGLQRRIKRLGVRRS